MKNLWKNKKTNCIIYLVFTFISIIAIALYFFGWFNCNEKIETFLISIGASLFASVVLAISIELSNESSYIKHRTEIRTSKLEVLKSLSDNMTERFAYCVLRCRNIWYDKKENSAEKTISEWLQSSKELFTDIDKDKNKDDNYRKVNLIYDIISDLFPHYFTVFADKLKIQFSTLERFEAEGYFNNDEINALHIAENLINSIVQDFNRASSAKFFEFDNLYECIKIIYNNLESVEDFINFNEIVKTSICR